MKWDKEADTMAVTFPQEISIPTNRGMLGKVAKIYKPLRLMTPVTLEGKFLYRDACKERPAWDAELLKELVTR